MSAHSETNPTGWRTPLAVLTAGCLIALIGFGARSVLGLFLEPMTVTRGWDRETFALAMAIQNLLWGLGVPFAGMLADKKGPVGVMVVGALFYFAGIWGMSVSTAPFALHITGGLITGIGVAFTSFSLVLAAMAKTVGPERRSFALGLGTAAGSFGQVVFSPLTQGLISTQGWESSLVVLAFCGLAIIPLAFVLPNAKQSATVGGSADQTLTAALREATAHRGYVLLTVGFFVCGFHVAFITVHFPAYITDLGLAREIGGYAIALVGLFNIAGAFLSGLAGRRLSKKYSLATIYSLRALVIAALLAAPKTDVTIYLFSASMGILWLSTVPLTTGIVAQIFGVRYMATLFGIVFFSHQLGSFLGVWLGGVIYDRSGNYDSMWLAGIVLGVLAAFLHLPIDEKALPRLATESKASG